MRIRSHPKHKKLKISLTFLTVALTFLSITKTPAIAMNYGNTIIVSTTADGYQPGTLRAAILAANVAHKRIVILLQPGKHYALTIPGAHENQSTRGDLDIHGDIVISGYRGLAIIDARGLGDRAFHVHKGGRLLLSNIRITGAQAASGQSWSSSGDPGGALYNEGTLSLANCIIVGNTSGSGGYAEGNAGQPPGGDGGGIFNIGTLVMSHTIVSSNACGGFSNLGGGGLWNSGIAFLDSCFVEANSCAASQTIPGVGLGMNGGNGAGIYNQGQLRIINSTLRGNTCTDGAGGTQPGVSDAFTPGGPAGSGGNGGGIYNLGTLTLISSIFCSNRCGNGGPGASSGFFGGAPGGGGSGGAICNFGTLNLTGCTLFANSTGSGGAGGSGARTGVNGGTGGGGGAIYSAGNLALTNCTISGNLTGSGGNGGAGSFPSGASGGDGGPGGGIYNTGILTAISCTVCSNGTSFGGAGGAGTAWGSFTIYDPPNSIGGSCGNGGNGGGIFTVADIPPNIGNSLIGLNSTGNGGTGGPGTTFSLNTNTETFEITNTVGPAGFTGSGEDLSGTLTSLGFNLTGNADNSTGLTDRDLFGNSATPLDPLLGPLQMNGGPTPTHALLPGSPAIDQGNSLGLKTDQRAHRRPVRFQSAPSNDGDASDIGAFECDRH